MYYVFSNTNSHCAVRGVCELVGFRVSETSEEMSRAVTRKRRRDVGVQCNGRELVRRFGCEKGTQFGGASGAKKTEDKVPIMRPSADYVTLKLLAILYEQLAKMGGAKRSEADEKLKQILQRMNELFMNAAQYEEIVRGRKLEGSLDAKKANEMKALVQSLRTAPSDVRVWKSSREILLDALRIRRLLTLNELAQIFFCLGRTFSIPEEDVEPLLGKLRQNQILTEQDVKDIKTLIRERRDVGGRNVLNAAPKMTAYVDLLNGNLVSRRRGRKVAEAVESGSGGSGGGKWQCHYQLEDIGRWDQEKMERLIMVMRSGPEEEVAPESEKPVARDSQQIDRLTESAMALLSEWAISLLQRKKLCSIRYAPAEPETYKKAADLLDQKKGIPKEKKERVSQMLREAAAKERDLSMAELEQAIPLLGKDVMVDKKTTEKLFGKLVRSRVADNPDLEEIYREVDFSRTPILTLLDLKRAIEKVSKRPSEH